MKMEVVKVRDLRGETPGVTGRKWLDEEILFACFVLERLKAYRAFFPQRI